MRGDRSLINLVITSPTMGTRFNGGPALTPACALPPVLANSANTRLGHKVQLNDSYSPRVCCRSLAWTMFLLWSRHCVVGDRLRLSTWVRCHHHYGKDRSWSVIAALLCCQERPRLAPSPREHLKDFGRSKLDPERDLESRR